MRPISVNGLHPQHPPDKLPSIVAPMFFVLLFLYLDGFVCAVRFVGGDTLKLLNSSGSCRNIDGSYVQQKLQQYQDSCAYNIWFSTADESLVVADQLARPFLKLQGYGFHEDVAWSIGCAWCSSAAAVIVASGGWDGALMWWNSSTGAFLFKQYLSQGIITAISGYQTGFSPSDLVLLATWKGSVFAVSPCRINSPGHISSSDSGLSPVVLWTAAASSTPLHSVCMCGKVGFAGSKDGTVTSVSLLDGKILKQTRISSETLWSMACTPGRDDRLVAVSGKMMAYMLDNCRKKYHLSTGDGSVYILSVSHEPSLMVEKSLALQPRFPLYSIAVVDQTRIFVGSRGGFIAGVTCSVNGSCLQDGGADLSLNIPVRALLHTTCRYRLVMMI